MRSEFVNYKIENLADVKSGKRLPKGHSLVSTKTNFPYIRLVDVSNGLVQQSAMLYLTKETQEKISRYIVKTGDVCLAIVGNTIGMVFQIDKSWNNANLTENAARLTNFKDNVASQYIYYFLTSTLGQNEILSRKVGSAQGKLPMYNIKSLEIPLPSLEIQKKIAHILSTLDDKIELNRKMNETLEAMAQAIFKSWFVDFDPVHAKAECKSDAELEKAAAELGVSKEVLELFPSAFVESEMGMIPEGWEVKSIKDFGRVVTGKTPPKKVEDAYTDKGKPFITPTDIDETLFATKTARNLSINGQMAVKNSEITAGSICVTCIGSQMGKTIVASINSFTNQQINSIILREDYLRNYLLLNLRGRRKEIFLLGSGGGSTIPLLNKTSFEKIDVLLPNKSLLEVFDGIVKDNISLVLQNDIENNCLSNTRDTLLPKLLSGELDVSEVEVS